MKNNTKNIPRAVFLHVFCFIAFFLLFQNLGFAQTKPLANVDGIDLIEYDLQLALNQIMPAGVFHGGFSSEKRATYRPRAIENMIDKELLYQETLKRGMSFDAGSIKKARKTMIDKIGNLKKYKQVLKKNGLTDEHYIRNLKKDIMIKKILKIEIDEKSRISDKETLEYYTNNVKSFFRPKAIRLRHIMISVKPNAAVEEKNKLHKNAVQLLARIKEDEDMAAL
ncbi:MAG: SurA N-terminal domain-containing protein, partial [Desulfobacula sp.]|nr:SurA N-terminal domain-containing protein [Desulfobacula sp.]